MLKCQACYFTVTRGDKEVFRSRRTILEKPVWLDEWFEIAEVDGTYTVDTFSVEKDNHIKLYSV